MIRCRFKTSSPDPRPVKWPIKHPYWITGQGDDYYVLVAYADDEEEIKALWPETYDLDSDECTEYKFTERFPKPDWLKEPEADNAEYE